MSEELAVSKRKCSSRRLIHRLLGAFRSYRRRKSFWNWILTACSCLILLVFFLKLLNVAPRPPITSRDHPRPRGYILKTEGCKIPDLDPLDVAVRRFIFDHQKVQCSNGVPPLVGSNATSIFLIPGSAAAYDVGDISDLECCFTPFWKSFDGGQFVVEFRNSCVTFREGINVRDEFVAVECFYGNSIIYKDFFAFVPEKEIEGPPGTKRLNVLVLGIDEVSRLNFRRQMPETLAVLKTLNATEFLGYNKVSDDIFANVVPMVAGVDVKYLSDLCWKSVESYFDECPFVWNHFEKRGFVTAFAEDVTWTGIFQYDKKGFYNQPTHYYWEPFNMIAQSEIGNQNRSHVAQCIGSRESYEVLLDYLGKFANKMLSTGKNYFGFFWIATISHRTLNKPKTGDDRLANLLTTLSASGALNDTVLIFLSDGGTTHGAITSTFQGNLESRLPFLYVALPERYKTEYPTAHANFEANSHQLTTPYDLHETMRDLLDPFTFGSEIGNNSQPEFVRRGKSLFGKIPSGRRCPDVGINEDFCACAETSKPLNDDVTVQKIAELLMGHVAGLLNRTECVQLKLESVLFAKRYSFSWVGADGIEDYVVIIKTKPRVAILEGTVRKTHFNGGYRLKIIEDVVVRNNGTSQRSDCTANHPSKKYCFCD